MRSFRKISVIVPALNEAEKIVSLLHSLQPLRERGHEVIVVDGGSQDETMHRAKPLADRVIISSRGRALQQNKGAAIASGEILWFVHSDCMVPEDADGIILSALADSKTRWGRFNARLSGPHPLFRVIEFMMNLRSCLTGMVTGDQATFVEREAFTRVGGFPDIALMEDIALSRKLKRSFHRPCCLRQRVTSSSRRWEKNGILRTVLLMWWLRLAYFLGVSPIRLANRYGYQQADNNNSALLVFARAPVPGKAKTRLIPALGENGSALLHERLVRMTMERVSGMTGIDVQLWCLPDVSHSLFSELADAYPIRLELQRGNDLGERMSAALESALREYRYVVIIGTDCPGLEKTDIENAFSALREGYDVVLGPAEDGGYVLIGATQNHATIFRAVDWGTSRVLRQTRERINQAGLRLFELPLRYDLDTPADLERFPELIAQL